MDYSHNISLEDSEDNFCGEMIRNNNGHESLVNLFTGLNGMNLKNLEGQKKAYDSVIFLKDKKISDIMNFYDSGLLTLVNLHTLEKYLNSEKNGYPSDYFLHSLHRIILEAIEQINSRSKIHKKDI